MLGVCLFECVDWQFSLRLFCSDVEIHHLETRQPLKFGKVSVLEEGPLRAAVSAELKYGQSVINVVVHLIILSSLALR